MRSPSFRGPTMRGMRKLSRSLDAAQQTERTYDVLAGLVEDSCANGPSVLIFESLQSSSMSFRATPALVCSMQARLKRLRPLYRRARGKRTSI
jgi:hypothetical protein